MSTIKPEISMSSVLTLNPLLVLREEDDGALLFDPETGDVRILNPTAVAVCKLLDGRRTLANVLEDLGEIFEGMDANAGGQVLALACDLYKIGAIGTLTELTR